MLAVAAFVVVACLGAGASAASADELVAGQIASPPPSGGSDPVAPSDPQPGSSQAPDPGSPSGSPAPESPAPESPTPNPPEQTQPQSGSSDEATPPPAPDDAAAGTGDSWTGAQAHPSDAAAQGNSAPRALEPSLSSADGRSGPPGSFSTGGRVAPPTAPGGIDVDNFWGTDSGGVGPLLLPSSGCGLIGCHRQAAGPLGLGASTESSARERDKAAVGTSKASEPPLSGAPGGPGRAPGQSLSLSGGGAGGAGTGFVLLSLAAILAAMLSLPNSTSFRLPTATWRLSAYVPPIESPG
jgi:hypothetical protein